MFEEAKNYQRHIDKPMDFLDFFEVSVKIPAVVHSICRIQSYESIDRLLVRSPEFTDSTKILSRKKHRQEFKKPLTQNKSDGKLVWVRHMKERENALRNKLPVMAASSSPYLSNWASHVLREQFNVEMSMKEQYGKAAWVIQRYVSSESLEDQDWANELAINTSSKANQPNTTLQKHRSEKLYLHPITARRSKKHGQISIFNKPEEQQQSKITAK